MRPTLRRNKDVRDQVARSAEQQHSKRRDSSPHCAGSRPQQSRSDQVQPCERGQHKHKRFDREPHPPTREASNGSEGGMRVCCAAASRPEAMTATGRLRAASRCSGSTGTAYRNPPRLTPPAPPPSASPTTRGSFGAASGQAQWIEGESTSDSPDTSGAEQLQLHSHTRYAEACQMRSVRCRHR